jgi:hypothetical protein
MSDLARALCCLEDSAGWEGCAHDASAPPELRIQLSIAISLKRIADSLDGTALGVDVSEGLAGLTHALVQGRVAP